jgi:UDP-N-acetyl-D-mannosaminuronate dehydrogenase
VIVSVIGLGYIGLPTAAVLASKDVMVIGVDVNQNTVDTINQDDLIALRSENDLDKLIPGLTGWAQVNGRDDLSIQEKILLEVEYKQKKSFWFDLRILLLIFLKVINRRGVSH